MIAHEDNKSIQEPLLGDGDEGLAEAGEAFLRYPPPNSPRRFKKQPRQLHSSFLGLDVDALNFDRPWSLDIYYDSIRGVEMFSVYFWIAKDLSWTQDWLYAALICGGFALFMHVIMLYHAILIGNAEETYMIISSVLWLTANFLWMFGEVVYDDDDVFTPDSNIVFITALCWTSLYYVVLRPLGLIKSDPCVKAEYEAIGIRSRFSYFEHWRQYEHLHTLFWLGKDYAWILQNPIMWIVFVIPTVTLALDFIWVTFWAKDMMVDCIHYVATFIWVMGNCTWACGEVFFVDRDDSPNSMWDTNRSTRLEFRWWASWILFSAYMPIAVLYMVWLPLTFSGALDGKKIRTPGHLVRLSHNLGVGAPDPDSDDDYWHGFDYEGSMDASHLYEQEENPFPRDIWLSRESRVNDGKYTCEGGKCENYKDKTVDSDANVTPGTMSNSSNASDNDSKSREDEESEGSSVPTHPS